MFISVPNNPELETLPESLADLPALQVLNIRNNPKLKIGPRVQAMIDSGEVTVVQ